MEFVGNFISLEEANERERQYTTINEGCFLLHFGAKMVVDGTRTYGRVGRLVNNASTNANSQSPSIVQGPLWLHKASIIGRSSVSILESSKNRGTLNICFGFLLVHKLPCKFRLIQTRKVI